MIIDYNKMMNDEGFREYLSSNFGSPSILDRIFNDGIPLNKITIIKGGSKIGSIVHRYIDYVDYLKIENRDYQINEILDEI